MHKKVIETFEEELLRVVSQEEQLEASLKEALMYAIGAGGKRIRPLMALYSALACGASMESAMPAACAIELLHNYTLVHDDLPSMDNDIVRRGAPTVWKKFGESLAILVGDALQALAFKCVSSLKVNASKAMIELSSRAIGVVSGQICDIRRSTLCESKVDVDFIYAHKTADLFIAAAKMGALAAGVCEQDVERAGEFALRFGMAFQYLDDISDGDGPYPLEEMTRRLNLEVTRAMETLEGFSGDTAPMKDLVNVTFKEACRKL